MQQANRIETIDFWRGLVLLFIFINHIPGNLLEQFTPRNFGLSDSAEAFVFVSGLAVSLAYFPKLTPHGSLRTLAKCLARAAKLYGVHIVMSLCALLLVREAFLKTDLSGFVSTHGFDISFDEPRRALIGLVLLSHQLGYFNILPLYVTLMVLAPFLLFAARRHVALALAGSLAVYGIARTTGLSLPNWPGPGTWFFNPFAWQLVFTLGLVTGILWRGGNLPYSRPLFALALAVLAVGLVTATDAFGIAPGLHDLARPWLDLGKTELGIGRLVHFLALAYVVAQIRLGRALLVLPGADKISLIGRHGLPVFAVGSLVAALGQIVLHVSGDSPVVGVVFVFTGILGLVTLAACLEWRLRFLLVSRGSAAPSPSWRALPSVLRRPKTER